MTDFLVQEAGTVHKKWTGLLPIALLYPNTYPLAVSNLGFQILYHLLNRMETVVCERFVYPERRQPFRSLESQRPLSDFPLIFASVSFEHDYPRLAGMLAAGGIQPFVTQRGNRVSAGAPLVVLGGVAVFMNPEPLAPFADLMVIGEAEPLLSELVSRLLTVEACSDRAALARDIASTLPGCYAPASYRFRYNRQGAVLGWQAHGGLPERIERVVVDSCTRAAHSTLRSPRAELGMFMVELGRGCSRGCRFCAAGFIYRPPRVWSGDAVVDALEERPPAWRHIGLLGMEMSPAATLDRIATYLQEQGCSLSFSSLRADRITPDLLKLLAASDLRSVAIAPDGCSQRLREVINKGLATDDLVQAAAALAGTGVRTLKLYVMIGLPTETRDDLDEFIALVGRIHRELLGVGRERKRICEVVISVNSFVPKPWTPFQYVGFGGRLPAEVAEESMVPVEDLRARLKYLRQHIKVIANVRIHGDRPDLALQQAVLARGDRRLAPVLLDIGTGKRSFKQAMKHHNLTVGQYALRSRSKGELFCWDIVNHGISKDFLWHELEKAVAGRPTPPCNTALCRRCGVCNAEQPA